jgi:hypothetical protein
VIVRTCQADGWKGIDKVLNAMGYPTHQLVRELACVGKACGWDPDFPAFREICFRTFAVIGNTKTHLEDTFNELRDAERGAKHKVFGKWNAYYRAANAASAHSEDMPTVQVLEGDWNTQPVIPGHLVNDHVFLPNSHKADELLQLRRLQRGRGSSRWHG